MLSLSCPSLGSSHSSLRLWRTLPVPDPRPCALPVMHSLMGGGLLCAVSGLVLLIVATATDFWMQYRYSGNLSHQGLWRYCVGGKCHVHTITIGAALRAVARMPLIQNAATRILSAFWDATRAFMLLSILSCFAGIILGLTTFSSSARLTRTRMAGITLLIAGLLALLGLSIYTGVTVNVFAKRYEDWRFSWSYILGWVGVILTISAGVFHIFAFSKDSSVDSSAVASS